MKQLLLKILLICIVGIHVFAIVVITIGLFLIPYIVFTNFTIFQGLIIGSILMATTLNLLVTKRCFLTIIEDRVRKKLGLKTIRKFIRYYFVNNFVEIKDRYKKRRMDYKRKHPYY